MLRAFLAVLLLLLLAGESAASCGLQFCPRPAQHGETAAWSAGLRTRWVSFDAGGTSGSYYTAAPQALWRPGAFAFGVEIPFTRLQADGEMRTGLSNPVLTAQYARRIAHAWSGEVGMQLELPLGDSEKGLADDHAMLLPWIGLRRDLGMLWQVSILAGYSQAMEFGHHAGDEEAPLAKSAHEGHDHGGAPMLVNPHGDREIQWRAGLLRRLGRSGIEGFALGQADLSDGGKPYARAGLSWDYALAAAFGLQVAADVPITAARRSEAEIGAGIKTGW